MTQNIEQALHELYRRQFATREQLLSEMLRVKMTSDALKKQPELKKQKEKLFQLMKKTTEKALGFFSADRADFFELFEILEEIDIFQFTLEIYKNDKLGTVMSPHYLITYVKDRVKKLNPSTILITEAEKHLAGLKEFIDEFRVASITLTTQHHLMYLFLKFSFQSKPNVTVVFESIYSDCLVESKFEYVYTLPTFSLKPDDLTQSFMVKDSDGIAMENMLGHLTEHGVLDIIVPSKITFAAQGYEKLRSYITEHFYVQNIFILPEGTFRPVTAVKTYLFTITNEPIEEIYIGTLQLNKNKFEPKEQKTITYQQFLNHEDWRIELLLSEDDENIQKFKSSHVNKVKLKDVAEVFRGKSILKKDTTVGSISVLNISNIENGDIDYSNMDTIEEDERKIKRYELEDGDVVLSCRGTAIKTAVFAEQEKTVIASANLIVIRPKQDILGDYIKIFFESPIGIAIIKSFQRGTTIMNINHADIMEMEIPLVTLEQQQQMVNYYHEERNTYQKIIRQAETKWKHAKEQLYNKFI